MPVVVLAEDGRVLGHWLGSAGQHHSQVLLAGIDQTLQKIGKTKNDIGAIAAGVGPGMFTGLRIGIATAQFLADVKNLPVIPFSSLLAQALSVKEKASRVWALGDAKSKRVYTLCLGPEDLDPLYQCKDDEVEALSPELAAAKMRSGDLVTGEGAHLYPWPKEVSIFPKQDSYFRPDALAQMAHTLLLAKRTISGLELQPRYLKTGQTHLP